MSLGRGIAHRNLATGPPVDPPQPDTGHGAYLAPATNRAGDETPALLSDIQAGTLHSSLK